jgi:GT2 family glycosyltransferase
VLPGELLVVDQAPSEEARAVVSASGLDGARYLSQPRRGLSASRNLALAKAARPFLAVTDEDCAPDATWLAAIVAALARPPGPAVVTGAILPLGQQLPGTYAVSLRDSASAVDYRGRVLPWEAGSGGNFAAECRLLRRLGGWDERLGAGSRGKAGEDSELIYRVLRAGLTVRYEPAAVIRHDGSRVAGGSPRDGPMASGSVRCAVCGCDEPIRSCGACSRATQRLHLRPLLRAAASADSFLVSQHARALASLPAGVAYGLRAPGSGPAPEDC